MSQPATAPTMADNFFLEAMKPAFREDPYTFYERFRGTAPLERDDSRFVRRPDRIPMNVAEGTWREGPSATLRTTGVQIACNLAADST